MTSLPGIQPASPTAAVSRYGSSAGVLWAGGFDPSFRTTGPWFVPDHVKWQMDTDDTVKQCWTIVKGLTLDREPTIICPYDLTCPSPTPQQQKDYEQARMVGDFVDYCCRTTHGGMWQWDYQLLDAMKHGLMVAVIVAKPELYKGDGKNQTKWTLDYLQILRRGEYIPYFDIGSRLKGFQVFGQTYEGPHPQTAEWGTWPIIWGREKFVTATFQPQDGGIWGNDLYAAAYLMYMLKNMGWEQWHAAIEQIGSPTAYHTTPEGLTANQRVPLTDANGNDLYWSSEMHDMTMLTPAPTDFGRAMASPQVAQHYTLQAGLRSLGLVGLAHGATLQYLQAQDSQNIPSHVDAATVGIHRAIVGTDKFAMRGTHESSGSSDAGERIASMPANDGKFMLEQCRAQLAYSLTLWNYGPGALPYRPRYDYGSGVSGDVAALLNSMAAMSTTNRATDAQIQSVLVNRCGFPQATWQDMQDRPEPAAVASTGNMPNDTAGTGT